MNKHTPGPWEIGLRESAYAMERTIEADAINSGAPLAIIRGDGSTKENEANARLIAAAPDMLEALKLARNSLRPFTLKPIGAPGSEARAKQDAEIEAYNTICAVIAKAEGRA